MTTDGVLVLESDFKINDSHGLYLASAVNKKMGSFGYNNPVSAAKLKKLDIDLPFSANDEIDFDYMETYIEELRIDRIKKLDEYLLQTGLNDYELTSSEIKVLSDFKNDNLKWGEFAISDLFKVMTSKKRFDANKITIDEQNGSPYVARTSLNNGIRGYINEDTQYLNKGNTISFGQDTATMFYQEKPYFTSDKIKIVLPYSESFNNVNAHFFITSMSKSFSMFTWGSSRYSVKVINAQKIKILIDADGDPDYNMMNIFIKAIEKLAIKDVVLWKDAQLKLVEA